MLNVNALSENSKKCTTRDGNRNSRKGQGEADGRISGEKNGWGAKEMGDGGRVREAVKRGGGSRGKNGREEELEE